MFKLNEAPNIALSAISSHKTARGCGMFWSVLLCVPTLGISVGCCDENQNSDWKGMFPRHPLTLPTKMGLKALVDILKQVRISPDKLTDPNMKEELKSQASERLIIEAQVKQTILILEEALRQSVIQGSYRNIINKALLKIKTRAQQEESLGNVLATEKTPLTGYDTYIPSYGFTRSKH